jgi:lysophospholipase L1-like esterase
VRGRRLIRALGTAVAAALVAALLLLPDLSRLPDRPLPPRAVPRDGLRIVAFGTSLTARAVWPDPLAEALSRCVPGGVTVARVAAPGVNSDWALANLGEVAAARPHLVVAEFAVNDADLADGLWPGRSRFNHRLLVRKLNELDDPPAILLVATAPVSGLAQWLKRPLLPLYQAAYADIAAAEGAGFLNATARWKALNGHAQYLPDGLHPDPAAEAELIAPALASQIAGAFGLACGDG